MSGNTLTKKDDDNVQCKICGVKLANSGKANDAIMANNSYEEWRGCLRA